jgi:hypothetical protein
MNNMTREHENTHIKNLQQCHLVQPLPWEQTRGSAARRRISYDPVLAPIVQPTCNSHNLLPLCHYNIRWSVEIKKFVVMLTFKRPYTVPFRPNVQQLPEFSDTSKVCSRLQLDQVSQIHTADGKMKKHNRIICLYAPGNLPSEICQQLSA